MKFKVGDKVRYAKNEILAGWRIFEIGEIMEVVEIDEYALCPYKCQKRENNETDWFSEIELELEEKNNFKFKVGDKVKLVDKRPPAWNEEGKMDEFLGSIQIIKEITFYGEVQFEEPKTHHWCFNIDDIECKVSACEIDGTKFANLKCNCLAQNWSIGVDVATSPIINESEENNMSYKKILKIFKERELKAINESYDFQKEDILSKDKIYMEIKKTVKKVNDMLEKDGQQNRLSEPSYYSYKTLETFKLFEELEINKKEEIDYLEKFLNEVEARLEMTNDYDKQIEILKTYKILDEEGKLNNEL